MAAYLDHAASTPLRPVALAAMMPWLTERFGNPSGAHREARLARRAIDDARDVVAEVVGADPGDVVFTSGGTEADNLAVLGTNGRSGRSGRSGRGDGRGGREGPVGGEGGPSGTAPAGPVGAPGPATVVASAVEHHAVLEAVAHVGGRLVPVDRQGRVDLEALAAALHPGVRLVSVMLVNNELGTVQRLDEVAEVVRRRAPHALLHTDAVQALTWLDLAERAAPADLVSLSAHKFGGPKGSGVLVTRPGVVVVPQLLGGGQERGRRSGTPDVAGVVGLAAAAAEAAAERSATVARIAALQARMLAGIAARLPHCRPTVAAPAGTPAPGGVEVVPGIVHLLVEGVESEALVFLLDEAGVCASAGSSCSSGAVQQSHVLAALGVGVEEGGAVRLSLGWPSTEADVDAAVEALATAAARLRAAP